YRDHLALHRLLPRGVGYDDAPLDRFFLLDALDQNPVVQWSHVHLLSPYRDTRVRDRKSTRLNSSHEWISYAVFCLKKKKSTITGEGKKRQLLQLTQQAHVFMTPSHGDHYQHFTFHEKLRDSTTTHDRM